MKHEDEQSLVKVPEITPGPLVLGATDTKSRSLLNMTGFALERITRERSEVPPGFKLPERPVYFMDPNSRRMVMVTNRDYTTGHYGWRSGLFAEVVELDEEGKPRFRLSTKEITLPDGQFIPVAVGPNEFNLPPSFIDMMEEDISGKKKFVPWNMYLGSLQAWMNELIIDPNDNFESFMKKFVDLRQKAKQDAAKKIGAAFPGGIQGFDETVGPYNLIISNDRRKDKFIKASREAGLFPVYVDTRDLVETEHKKRKESGKNRHIEPKIEFMIGHYLPADWGSEAIRFRPVIITEDWAACRDLEDGDREFTKEVLSPLAIQTQTIQYIRQNNPIFGYVFISVQKDNEPAKEENGSYVCPNNEQTYREFLYKIKSDLVMTTFVRGGSPMV